MLRMPERPVRNSVFAILRAMPFERGWPWTAMRMPSICRRARPTRRDATSRG